MFQYICSILVVYLIRSSSAFIGQNNLGGARGGGGGFGGGGGGGSIFDAFLNAFSPTTAAPYMDPFSNNYGRGNPNMLAMMADIDYADQLSSRADALAAKKEARQGINEAKQGQQPPTENAKKAANIGQRANGETPYPRQGLRQSSSFNRQRMAERRNPESMSPSHVSAGDATHPSIWTFRQNNPVKQPNRTQTINNNAGFLPHQERNRLRLQHVLRPSGAPQLKDLARQALSRKDVTKTPRNIPPRRFRQRSPLDRIPPRRRNIDPDLMADMMDVAGDFGMASMLMGQMMPQPQRFPGRGRGRARGRGRCDLNSSRVLLEFVMTGKMCGTPLG